MNNFVIEHNGKRRRLNRDIIDIIKIIEQFNNSNRKNIEKAAEINNNLCYADSQQKTSELLQKILS